MPVKSKPVKPIPTPILLSAENTSVMLSMSESFFRQLVSIGKFPRPIKYGKKSLWSVEIVTECVRKEAERQGVTA